MKKTIFTLITLAFIGLSTATAQVGIGTTTPDASAILDLDATDKGFLPPRLTSLQRNNIASPVAGLTIYNTNVNRLQYHNGIGWVDVCSGSTFGFIPGNVTCATATISLTPCSEVSGATLNDIPGTGDGIEYDWTGATGFVDGGTTHALVEIGGQCWFGRNTTALSPYIGTNDWNGYYSNASSEPALGEGLLYQWDAAMKGSTTERAQGVCPDGWHISSDCEWMYLENTLGMGTADQQLTGTRNSGSVGSKLSTLTSGGTNSSGFTALLAGYRTTSGTFFSRGVRGNWWSSSEASATNAQSRAVFSAETGVGRGSNSKAFGFSVRCLKD